MLNGEFFALLGFAIAAGAVIISDHNKYTAVKTAVRKKAVKIASESKTDWMDEFALSSKRSDAKKVLDSFEKAERDRINEIFTSTQAAKDATKAFNKANQAYEAAKKAVTEYKPSQTKVAVGTGDSAISLDMINTDKKAELEMKLAELKAERESAKLAIEDIKRDIASRVREERPIEHTKALEDFNKAAEEYSAAKLKNEKTVSDILSDNEWYNNECRVELKKIYSKGEIVIKAVLLSIIPVATLILIWERAINDIGFIYGGV